MDFTFTISEKKHLAGITAAREAYNAALPKDEQGDPIDEILTDQAYVDLRFGEMCANALDSYAVQFQTDTVALTAKRDELQAKIDAISAKE